MADIGHRTFVCSMSKLEKQDEFEQLVKHASPK